jgi:hypothetical protein
MPGVREAAHVGADFRQYRCRRQAADARNGVEKTDQGSKAGLTGRHLLVHPRDRGIDLLVDPDDPRRRRVVLVEVQLEQEAVVPGQTAMQRIIQRLRRGLDPAIGQRRQMGWTAPAASVCHDGVAKPVKKGAVRHVHYHDRP